jgi:hypothetical protein
MPRCNLVVASGCDAGAAGPCPGDTGDGTPSVAEEVDVRVEGDAGAWASVHKTNSNIMAGLLVISKLPCYL